MSKLPDFEAWAKKWQGSLRRLFLGLIWTIPVFLIALQVNLPLNMAVWGHSFLTILYALALWLILVQLNQKEDRAVAPPVATPAGKHFLHGVPVSPNCAGQHVPACRSPGAHFFHSRCRLGGGGALRHAPLGVHQPETPRAPTHPGRAPVPLLTAIKKTTT